MGNTPAVRSECARLLEAHRPHLGQLTAFVGLDGFVDDIIHVVDQRQDAEHFSRIPTITDFSKRIGDAAGRSTNIELVSHRTKIGGNGPIMANALSRFGMHVTYLGTLGYPNLHPVFEDFANRTEAHSIALAAHTNALEFNDGKILASLLSPLTDVTWNTIIDRFGKQQLSAKVLGCNLVGFVNWTMIPYMSEIWERVLSEICADRPKTRRKIFFDLADPEKRTPEDIRRALGLIEKFSNYFDVILGLNEKEAFAIGEVLGLPAQSESADGIGELMRGIVSQVKIETLVVHPVRYALAISAGEVSVIAGPFIEQPVITTGAGDHFNAGFCLGQLLGLDNPQSLLCGVSTSGYYVRNGCAPTVLELIGFIENWPEQSDSEDFFASRRS
ncbi:MAG: PfkB family carbohydrate kinase [Verrucomicrobiia bacterium]|jgi:sugar/nucleoside kinase (ribokinase family)